MDVGGTLRDGHYRAETGRVRHINGRKQHLSLETEQKRVKKQTSGRNEQYKIGHNGFIMIQLGNQE